MHTDKWMEVHNVLFPMIDYRLPAASHVSLRIYDMASRLMRSLVNRDMHAGYHSVEWDKRGMVPAVYFINLKAGEQSMVKRMVGF